jgi:hypothetical protein
LSTPAVAPAPPPAPTAPPISPRPADPPRPHAHPRPSAPGPADIKVDFGEVIELPHKTRKGPPLLRDDVTILVRSTVQARAADCATPPLVEIESVQLQADGPGTLEEPRSRLNVELNVSNRGGDARGCERATLELRARGARVSEQESVENSRPKTVAHRSVSFTFPRTQSRVDLCVGDECAVTLDLMRGRRIAR